MRILSLLCTAGYLLLLSYRAEAMYQQQEPRITITAKSITLAKLFEAIYEQTKLQVFYSNSVLNDKQVISVDFKEKPVKEVLDLVLKGKGLVWNNSGNGYIRITKKKEEQTKTDQPGVKDIDSVTTDEQLPPMRQTILQEVVINKGYYTESRRVSTGSVGRITASDISKQPVGNLLQTIYARVPGVVVTQQSGMPGGSINIQVRGQNSLRNTMEDNGNYPLYVIDGVPYFSTPLTTNAGSVLYPQGTYARGTSPFNSLNPADIEAIEILKDADATSIYGSRGANGVILITTKKGKSGLMKVDANFYTGAGKVTRRMKLLNTQQYLEMRKEAFKNDNITTYSPFDYDVNGTWDQNKNHDWQKELIGGTATTTDAQIAVSGGNNLNQYRFGGGYHRETAVFPGDFSDQRGSGHISLTNSSPNNKFKSQISVSYSMGLTNMLAQDLTSQALTMAPNMPDMIDENGNLLWGPGVFTNPYASTKQPYKARTSNFISSATLSYELLQGFFIKANMGYTSTTLKEIQKTPVSTQVAQFQQYYTNMAQFSNGLSNSWIIEPQLHYQQSFNKHSFKVLAGITFQNEERDQLYQTASGFSSESLMDNVSAVPSANVFNAYNYYKYRYNALFGRLNYSYAEKYIVNLTGRRDGSSRFGPGKQFADFGSLGAAWIFSEENFIKDVLPFLNHAKLRSSYGITGNDQIPNYGFLDTYSTNGAGQYQGVSGLIPVRLFNPDFRWETNKKFEIALELGALNNRLNFTAAWFRNRSSNQLVGYSLPPTAGFTSIQYNLPATVQNTGLEVELFATILDLKNIKWSGSFNITVPRNKLVAYPNLEGSSYAYQYVVGKSLSNIRQFKFLGVDPQTGLYTVEDVNKDNAYNTMDYVVNSFIGQRFYGGFQNTITFKQFSLDFLFQFVKQNGRNYLINFFNAPGSSTANQPVEVMNRWQQQGDNASIQKFTTSFPSSYSLFTSSNAAVSDASFIRLKNLSLSYRLPNAIIERVKLNDLRIYVQGQNLLTITGYRGLDPETQSTALPPLRMLTGGIQLSL